MAVKTNNNMKSPTGRMGYNGLPVRTPVGITRHALKEHLALEKLNSVGFDKLEELVSMHPVRTNYRKLKMLKVNPMTYDLLVMALQSTQSIEALAEWHIYLSSNNYPILKDGYMYKMGRLCWVQVRGVCLDFPMEHFEYKLNTYRVLESTNEQVITLTLLAEQAGEKAPLDAEYYETDRERSYVQYWRTSSNNPDHAALLWWRDEWEFSDDCEVCNRQLQWNPTRFKPIAPIYNTFKGGEAEALGVYRSLAPKHRIKARLASLRDSKEFTKLMGAIGKGSKHRTEPVFYIL